MLPNTRYIYDFLTDKYGLKPIDTIQTLSSGLIVYPKDYFSPLNSATGELKLTANTYAIHHYNNSWISLPGRIKRKLRMIITRLIGEDNKENIRRLLRKNQ